LYNGCIVILEPESKVIHRIIFL